MHNPLLDRVGAAVVVLLFSLMAGIVGVGEVAGLQAPQGVRGPLTTAEASGFKATTRHAEMMDFIRELQRRSGRLRVETMAVSTEGRELPMMVIGNPPPASPLELRNDGRAVVYLQANIHAGEVEGKEALQMLARDIVMAEAPPTFLDDLVILVVPMFNPDGNEKISTENRSSQDGPEQGVGERHNGQNLDLNREGMKLESPEARGLVANMLERWDPIFFLDAHTHNGSYHEEPVTYTWGFNHNTDREIIEYAALTLSPAIERRLLDDHGVLAVPHGDFIDIEDPEAGWIPAGPEPRFLTNYIGIRNRFSILNEQYPYVDFETRVRGCYALAWEYLEYIAEHKQEMRDIVAAADRRTIEAGRSADAAATFGVEHDVRSIGEPHTVLGYAMTRAEGGRGGRGRTVVDFDTKVTYEIPYLADYYATRSVPLPRGYLVPIPAPEIERKLLQHGLLVEKLTEPVTLDVVAFVPSDVTREERAFQGHFMRSARGTYEEIEREFPAGTLYVTTAQPLGKVAATLLEPESDDGLVAWNFLDRYLAGSFGRPSPFPIYKLMAPAEFVRVSLTRD